MSINNSLIIKFKMSDYDDAASGGDDFSDEFRDDPPSDYAEVSEGDDDDDDDARLLELAIARRGKAPSKGKRPVPPTIAATKTVARQGKRKTKEEAKKASKAEWSQTMG